MPVRHKHKIAREFFGETRNSHEMDSLAAAIIAWKANRKSIEKNNKKAGDMAGWLRRNKTGKI